MQPIGTPTGERPPTVTVLLRVYNGSQHLAEAVESVLAQSYRDFELLVIDDGSTDATPAILEAYSGDDRVRVIRQANQGVSAAARRGVEEARGVYIAILDSDDRSHPDRLERQVEFLGCNPSAVIVGSALRIIDEHGHPIGRRRYPTSNEHIRAATMLYNPFAHSSVCFRRHEALACGSYRTEFRGAEDFDFNIRLRMFGEGANLTEALTDYRVHKNAFKRLNFRRQLIDTIRLRQVAADRYGYSYPALARLVDAFQRTLLVLPPSLVFWMFKRAFYRKDEA